MATDDDEVQVSHLRPFRVVEGGGTFPRYLFALNLGPPWHEELVKQIARLNQEEQEAVQRVVSYTEVVEFDFAAFERNLAGMMADLPPRDDPAPYHRPTIAIYRGHPLGPRALGRPTPPPRLFYNGPRWPQRGYRR